MPNHSITRYFIQIHFWVEIYLIIYLCTMTMSFNLYLMYTEYIACPTTSLISGIKVERLILMFTCSPVSTVKENVT